jgi:ATP-dependent protease HslVU (ClpYQ) peptidase subunit
MTTIAVVRKSGHCAIAADTLTKWGSGKESAAYIANHDKIIKVGASYLGVTGSATFKTILTDYFARPRVHARFNTPIEIFRTWHKLHTALKRDYFLVVGDEEDESLESSRMDVLIANPRGIFGIAAHRTAQEFSRFYAFGSGSDYALGAIYAVYDRAGWGAERIARFAIEAAGEFDDGTALPVTSQSVKLARR